MEFKTILTGYFLFANAMGRNAQVHQYPEDIATLNFEPDNDLFTVILAGYSAPRKERLVPKRLKKSENPAITAITGAGNALYFIKKTLNR